jgi:hypothetical protein
MDLIYGPAILRLLTVAAGALAHTGIQTTVVTDPLPGTTTPR